jgi:hypothetical protein
MGNELSILPLASDENNYPLLRAENDNEMRDLQGNLDPRGINARDLPSIKAPSGGTMAFLEKTLHGEDNPKEIKGIIGSAKTGRLFWYKGINEGGGRKPPDCVSRDGLVGEGDPGGECGKCGFSQFGSAPRGRGQACKQARQLLILRPGEILPYLLTVPPTSLKNCGQYFLMLYARKLPFWAVVTRLTLEKASNEDGVAYAKILFSVDRMLDNAERQAMKQVQAQMKRLLDPVAIDASEYAIEDEEAAIGGQTADASSPDAPF